MNHAGAPDASTRETVAAQLRRSQAQVGLAALDHLDPAIVGRRPDGFEHSIWELVEHLRLAAEDLVDYVERDDYSAPAWPDDYWPAAPTPESAERWNDSVAGFRQAIERMAKLVEDPARPLHDPVPTAEDPSHHLLRCALVLLDHNAYHLGQVVDLRRALGDWPPGR
ncbi:MAG: DinB family protein [Acidobacteria bacterium]|nr:DinB family protein [Acidobacteriota bacterium]